MTSTPAPRLRSGLIALFAFSGGVAVGNLYWAQPLLGQIGASLDITPAASGLLLTVTQIGYAIGVLLLVPLGDVVDRGRLIPLVTVLSALMLLATAFAPELGMILVSMALVGFTTVSGQLLTPLAGDLASDDQHGHAVSTVASGLMLGILVSRALSGLVAGAVGWRGVYVLATALTAVAAVLLWRCLPSLPSRERVPYRGLIGSVFTTVVWHRPARILLPIGFCVMAVFTMFWTGITFLLSSPTFGFDVAQIGLVSLVGITGAVAAQRVGRLYDRGLGVPAIAAGLGLTLLALAISQIGQNDIGAIIAAVAVLSVGIQSALVLLQTTMLSLDPAARSRLNTVFVVSNFVGGALGSALAGAAWAHGGWTALAILAGATVLTALLILGAAAGTKALTARSDPQS